MAANYEDPGKESALFMGPTGGDLVLITDLAHISSELPIEIDSQKAKGANLGREKFLGLGLAKFKLNFVVMADEEEHFWANVLPLFRVRKAAGNAPALRVRNPQVNRCGVDTVYVTRATIEAPSGGMRSISVDLRQWAPAPVEPKKEEKKGVAATAAATLQPEAAQKNQKKKAN